MRYNKKIPFLHGIIVSAITVVAVAVLLLFVPGGPLQHIGQFVNNQNKSLETLSEILIEDKVDSLDINWNGGGTRLIPAEKDQILLVEKSYGKISEPYQLDYQVDNRTLKITGRNKDSSIFRGEQPATYLEAYIPKNLYKVNLTASSGTCDLTGLDAYRISCKLHFSKIIMDNLKTTFMDLDVNNSQTEGQSVIAKGLNANITEGSLLLKGSLDNIDLSITRGSAEMVTDLVPGRLFVRQTSGKADITIPDNDSFSVLVRKTSGSFNTEFDMDIKYDMNANCDRYTYKEDGPLYNIYLYSSIVNLVRE